MRPITSRAPALAALTVARMIVASALLLAAAGAASAQNTGADCEILLKVCRAACAPSCVDDDAASCRKACEGDKGCLGDYAYCREQAGLPPIEPPMTDKATADKATADKATSEKAATHDVEPKAVTPEAASAPAARSVESRAAPVAAEAAPASRVMSLDQPVEGGSLEGRIFFLKRAESEPDALFYGYLVIGPNVSEARKLAVIQGLACRLDVVTSETAASVERLGLVTIPALTDPQADVTSPQEMLSAYDFPRAERWMRAAGFSVEEEFDIDSAVLFIGSRIRRARQLDAVLLPGPDSQLDPVVADASALSPRYLERWTAEIVEGVRNGSIRSRQDLQTLMETHSWLETIGAPIASLLRIAPAQAAPPPASCL